MGKTNLIIIGFMFLISLGFVGAQITGNAIVVDAEYVTIFPGEETSVKIDIENNEAYDIEDVSVLIILNTVLEGIPIALPFTIIGSSEEEIDKIKDGEDEYVSFDLKASTEITPGDYNIPYTVSYSYIEDGVRVNPDPKTGSFGLRVSAKTDLDFSVETRNAIVGSNGKISLEIVNKGLGKIKSMSVEIVPDGFELFSKDKIFVGTIDPEDSDLVSFDVLFQSETPTLFATVTYKDFDNNDITEEISLSVNAYSRAEALELGLISESRAGVYMGIVGTLIILWFVWRQIKKVRKKRKREGRG